MKKRGLLTIILLFAAIAFLAGSQPKVNAQEATMYLEPSSIVYDLSNATVGTKFNVTVWLEGTTVDLGGAQVTIYYDPTLLNFSNYYIPYEDPDFFYSPRTSVTVLTYEGPDYFTISLSNPDLPPAAPFGHDGKIVIFEFEILQLPQDGQLGCTLNIDNADTFVIDSGGGEVSVVKQDGSFLIVPEFSTILGLIALATMTLIAVISKKYIEK